MKTLRLVILILAFAFPAFAATFTVTRSDDRNLVCVSGVDCSLREAVNAANDAPTDDVINFASDVTLITLANEIAINNAGTLAISGNGANVLTVSGNGVSRLFSTTGAVVSIQDVTLTNGGGGDLGRGGAVFADGGSLALDRVYVTGNSAYGTGGGGVRFQGGANHRILNSTFSGNHTERAGGGFYSDGGTITVVNSTFSGNSAGSKGGGFYVGFEANATIRSVTVTNNTAGFGGGFWGLGAITFSNTIASGNTAEVGHEIYSQGAVISAGNNLVGDSSGDSIDTGETVTYQPSDIRDRDPMLGALQNNGGTTLTHALLSGSPAINAGNNTNAPAADQRGMARIGGGIIDIGAFESSFAPTAAVVLIGGRAIAINGRGINGATLTLTDSNGINRTTRTTTFGYFRFENAVSGMTYILSIRGKNFRFSQPTQILTVFADAEIDFVGDAK